MNREQHRKEVDNIVRDSCRFNWLLAALCVLVVAMGVLPSFARAEEPAVLTQGDIRTGTFPICSDLDNAIKMATILADEGEEKANAFQQDPATPCGTTAPNTPWMIGEVLYVLQGADKEWVRVVELLAPPHIGITRYWVTKVEVKKAATGRKTNI